MGKNRGFEAVKAGYQAYPQDVTVLPVRGTKTSAGIDFFTTEEIVIKPQETIIFKTDVKAYMQSDEMLLIMPRSSTGFKHNLMLVNTIGLIDSDFYGNPENDGNIGCGLFNYRPSMRICGYGEFTDNCTGGTTTQPLIEDLTEKNTVRIPKGTKIVQGVFVKYLEADNCVSNVDRAGGIGSTGDK